MTEKRIALVTGGNRGIGYEICRQLAGKDIFVLLGARNENRGRQAADRLSGEGLTVETVRLDVTSPEDIKRVRDYLEEQFGRLDILVNNAGIAHPSEPLFSASASTVSPAVLRETFDVNFFAAVELTQALLPLIRKSEAGRIVNISSMLGSLSLHSRQDTGLAQIKPFAYDASKTALNQFTVHLAAELAGTSVKVNSAHPGWVRTELGGEEAPMEPEEGAATAVALATVGPDGANGKFIHEGEELPW